MHFYRQVYLAITDFGFYAHVFEQPLSRSLRYLLYLAGHAAIVVTLYYGWIVLPAASRVFDWAGERLPPMRVEAGRLTVDADQPLKLQYPGETVWTIMLDTTGMYRDTRGLEEPSLLLTRDHLFLTLEDGPHPQPLEWRSVPDFQLPADLPAWRTAFNWGFFPLAYSLWLLRYLLFKSLQALLLTPLAMSVGSLYGVRLPVRQGFTIGLYALTPAVVIDLAVRWTGLTVSYFDLLYIGIAGIYTYMAAQRCSMAR